MHAWKFLLKVKLSYNLFSYKNNQNQTEHLSQNQDSFLVKLSRLKFKCFYWSKRYNLESQSETFDRCSLVFRLMAIDATSINPTQLHCIAISFPKGYSVISFNYEPNAIHFQNQSIVDFRNFLRKDETDCMMLLEAL